MNEPLDRPVLESQLVGCRICGDLGTVRRDGPGWFEVVDCPCKRRRPCDVMCRCSGGPL